MPDHGAGGWFTPAQLRNIIGTVHTVQKELAERKGTSIGEIYILRQLARLVEAIVEGATEVALAAQITTLVEIPAEIERAYKDLVAGAEAQAREFGEELEALQENREHSPTPGDLSKKAVASELARRFAEEQRVQEVLDEIETTLAENRRKDTELERLIAADPGDKRDYQLDRGVLADRIRGGETTHEEIVAGLSNNSEKMRLLRIYLDAMKTLEDGLPDGILGETLTIIAPPKQ